MYTGLSHDKNYRIFSRVYSTIMSNILVKLYAHLMNGLNRNGLFTQRKSLVKKNVYSKSYSIFETVILKIQIPTKNIKEFEKLPKLKRRKLV